MGVTIRSTSTHIELLPIPNNRIGRNFRPFLYLIWPFVTFSFGNLWIFRARNPGWPGKWPARSDQWPAKIFHNRSKPLWNKGFRKRVTSKQKPVSLEKWRGLRPRIRKIAKKDPLNFSPAMNMLYQKFFLFDILHFAVIIKATVIFIREIKNAVHWSKNEY